VPSQWTTGDHLTKEENGYLKIWNSFRDKQLLFDQVVDLFYQESKTPKWVDSSIVYSTRDLTLVQLFFSRQFSTEDKIYYMESGTGPFKAVVEIPPDHLKVIKDGKFDLNWKRIK